MEVTEKAPAKINLMLNVLGKRDDGFHEMEMVMTSIDLADRLTLTSREDNLIKVTSDSSFMPNNERNIVYKTAALLRKTCGLNYGVHIDIQKNIPIAAGLAGGSTDAAAVLRGLNKLWNCQLQMDELEKIGSEIGSDVPYCLYGGTAYATGRGEQIEKIPDMPKCWVVLVKPPKGISSWTVFRNLNFKELPVYDCQGMLKAIHEENYQGIINCAGNALEKVSAEQQPLVTSLKQKMLDFGADTALMSGTGPTIYALTQKRSKAERLVNALNGFCKEVHMVRNLP